MAPVHAKRDMHAKNRVSLSDVHGSGAPAIDLCPLARMLIAQISPTAIQVSFARKGTLVAR